MLLVLVDIVDIVLLALVDIVLLALVDIVLLYLLAINLIYYYYFRALYYLFIFNLIYNLLSFITISNTIIKLALKVLLYFNYIRFKATTLISNYLLYLTKSFFILRAYT